jgi:hypothetical protein
MFKYLSFAYVILFGEALYWILSKPYFLTVSDRRVFLHETTLLVTKPKQLVFSDELNRVSLVRVRSGPFNSRGRLEHAGEKPYEFRVRIAFKSEIDAAISAIERAQAATGSLAASFSKFS